MFINIPRKPEETINKGVITMEVLHAQSIPDTISAHIPSILLDSQIGKSYDDNFFRCNLAVKKVLCQCD